MKKKTAIVVLAISLVGLVLSACGPSDSQIEEWEALKLDNAKLEGQLEAINSQIAGLRDDEAKLETKVAGLESEFEEAVKEKEAAEDRASKLETQAASLSGELSTKDSQLSQLKTQLTQSEARVAKFEAELAKGPQDPTYDELMEFMAKDETDKEWEKYRDNNVLIVLFLKNARNAGIRGYIIAVKIKADQYLGFVGFETTDKGWIYIWPALDQIVKLEVGRKYHQLNNTRDPGVDDTIEEIIILN